MNFDTVDLLHGIVAIEFKRKYFDCETMQPGHRDVYTVYENGKITYRHFVPKNRKPVSSKTAQVSPFDVKDYYSCIIECMRNADRVESYIDDSDGELTICHINGKIVLPRGLSSKQASLESIIYDFLESINFSKWD